MSALLSGFPICVVARCGKYPLPSSLLSCVSPRFKVQCLKSERTKNAEPQDNCRQTTAAPSRAAQRPESVGEHAAASARTRPERRRDGALGLQYLPQPPQHRRRAKPRNREDKRPERRRVL